MASCRGRLGTFLSRRSDLLELLQVLDSTPSPRGRELASALVLREHCAARWPSITWQVRRVGQHGANLVATHGPGPLLYSHLDTSLDDGPRGLDVDDATVTGFGLTVARAPVAAALLAFTSATAGTLLLASSGTHRRGGATPGVVTWLDANPAPSSAIVAKCGPAGVLWSEPGALYLTVRLTGGHGYVMFGSDATPPHGLAAALGPVLDALSAWCADYVAAQPDVDQAAAAAGVGAVTGGRSDKPDLFATDVEIALYVVTVHGADVAALADDVAARVRAAAPEGITVAVEAEVVGDAASTDPTLPIVRTARSAWTRTFGEPERVTRWTGSTDGVVLRSRGIPTVRLGPQASASADDPRRDVLQLSQLEGFTTVYRELLEEQ